MSTKLTPGTTFAGDFRVVRPLREGGMGAVYVVEQLSTGAERALKIMQPQLVDSDVMRRRFEQEARVGSRIKSEHVVQVLGAGVDDESGIPWLVMELLEGEDLSIYAKRRGPLPLDEVVGILQQSCHALGAAHRAGVVHRDLKPENLFLARSLRDDVAFTVKVLDFGIAKVVAEAQTMATGAVGTPAYMAPEQTSTGQAITPAADVWALGLITFRLLTGKSFWRAGNAAESTPMMVLREVAIDALPSPEERARELGVAELLPAGVATLVERCLQRDPNQRLPDADAFRTALGELGQPGAVAAVVAPANAAETTDPHGATEALTAELAPTVHASGGGSASGVTTHGAVVSSPESDAEIEQLTARLSGEQRSAKPLWLAALAAVVLLGGLGAFAAFADGDEQEGGAAARGGCPPNMILLPAGEYTLGDTKARAKVQPFCMDRTEVTAAEYGACVATKQCESDGLSCERGATYDADSKQNHPINCVSWEQAVTFCNAKGKRLPSEQEWEWAARGGARALGYPWGDDPPRAQLCWSGEMRRLETCPVAQLPAGNTLEGISGLAGNVAEWTSSRFEPTGTSRVYRGGSWIETKPLAVRAAARHRAAPSERGTLVGFRCVSDPVQQ